jgi:hypothetical protein
MSKYEVGYGKPPKHSQFKKGVCANPKGRGKRTKVKLGDIVENALNAEIKYQTRGRTKKSTRLEFALRTLINSAVKGDTKSAAMILTMRAHARKHGNIGAKQIIEIENWLPDYAGETGAERTARMREARTLANGDWPATDNE